MKLKGLRFYDRRARNTVARGIESARMTVSVTTRQAPRPAGHVRSEVKMKSLFALLFLVLFAGVAVADVPAERKLPQYPPSDLLVQNIFPSDRPANDQPSAPRILMPFIMPGVDDPSSPPGVDDPNAPPKANRPGRSPSRFARNGLIGELDMVRQLRPADRPRSIMPVQDPRINDPRSGPRFVYPVKKPLKSPDRGPIGIDEDIPVPRHFPQFPPNNPNPDRVRPGQPVSGGPIVPPRYVMPVQPPPPGPSDEPYVGHPDNQGSEFPLYLGLRNRGPDAGLDMTRPGPKVEVPGPVFRNLIQVHFGHGASRVPVTGRLFDMNGRLVYSKRVQGGPSVSFSGARLASLPAGNYVLQLDCGGPSKYVVRLSKAE
jgi:hypothetical protein